jgi:hypothetical protein
VRRPALAAGHLRVAPPEAQRDRPGRRRLALAALAAGRLGEVPPEAQREGPLAEQRAVRQAERLLHRLALRAVRKLALLDLAFRILLGRCELLNS